MSRILFRALAALVSLACTTDVFAAYNSTITPNSITADNGSSYPVTFCLKDALGNGVSGVTITWTNYSGGSVTVAGVTGVQGTVKTGTGGCVISQVSANSVPPNQSTDYIAFASPNPYQTTATLTLSALWTLQAIPSSVYGNAATSVTLTLKSSNGTSQPNVLILVSCTSSGGVTVNASSGAVSTNSAGQSIFSLTPSGAVVFNQTAGSSVCTFSTPYPGAVGSTNVTAQGLNACALGYLPEPPACGNPAP